MELFFEHHYAHSIEKVWNALTTSEALAEWLMPNDFKPEVGHECVFRFCAEPGEEDSLVYVTVAELLPPHYMKWLWRHEQEAGQTTLTFELEAARGGTTLRLRHSGDAPSFLVERLAKGWPSKLEALAARLAP